MLTQEAILNFLKESKKYFYEKYQITKIGLFGSFARNEQTESSDIDIIIEMAPGTNEIFEKKQELRQYLIDKFQREVDICTEKYIKPIFRNFILNETIYV